MIKSKDDLKRFLELEKNFYIKKNLKEKIIQKLVYGKDLYIYKYVKLLRKTEYYYNLNKCVYRNILYTYYKRNLNKLGTKLGIEMWENTFDIGLQIFHTSGIVVNGNSKIGKDCKLHGNNCIGNNGKNEKAPIIGNNVEIGVGAKIIGDVFIADDIIIGAGAIVNKSFYEKGITIAGIPARKIK